MFNCRDVGGYPARDGRTVRWGRLYRSDTPHRLDGTDLSAFAALGVRTVVDLRRPAEVERDGRVPHLDGMAYRHIHPEHVDWAENPYEPGSDLVRYLADRYTALAETGAAGLAEAVGLIADAANAPVLVHCVAGKDRTGVVCALTLAALGVADADIAVDYALSAAALERFQTWYATVGGRLGQPPLTTPAEAMTLFLARLRQRYGTVEDYLRGAGLTDAQLAALRGHLLA
ncbi:tyrosine-protein phosphatase [Micromonospora sp. KC721]|uniref:tyrosine-protein phosphatase n=1 Tax=Micromonospora sp. KC721 TaxID=2530380 RepID=UPI001FB76D2C|nr:tyrosine-protein phosphatase [Micromonospora sp. KC721]